MKKLMLLMVLCLYGMGAFAQNQVDFNNLTSNLNGFNRTMANDPDSALYYLHNIVRYNPEKASHSLHDQFAQSFSTVLWDSFVSDTAAVNGYLKGKNMSLDSLERQFKARQMKAYKLLAKFKTDTSAILKSHVYPLSMWVDAQDHKDDPTKLSATATAYLQYLNTTTDFYTHREARYGLHLVVLMTKFPQLESRTEQLLNIIYNHLRDYLNNNPDQFYGPLKNKRSWYSGMFAAANYFAAQQSKDTKQRLAYLKLAAQYSPDDQDSNTKNQYFYDLAMLFGTDNKSFEADYVNAMDNNEERLRYAIKMSLINPGLKVKAKSLYKDPANFNSYWQSEFNKKFEPAPIFSLPQIDGKQYKLADIAGQWTLIDFWGTGAPSSTDELPALEKLYQSTQNQKKAPLNIITIACKDDKTNVIDFMKRFNYKFPVVMSDGQIEADYAVSYWPSKFLVSPQGIYVAIPIGVDWVKYVEDYIKDI
jgi:peroxiredoxin